jgi:hypothetical protein
MVWFLVTRNPGVESGKDLAKGRSARGGQKKYSKTWVRFAAANSLH